MPNRALHNLGINTDWNLGEDGWKEGMGYNLLLLDTLAQPRVLDIGQNSPPGSPSAGDVHVVGDSPSGDWTDRPHAIAVYDDGAWTLVDPLEGWRVHNLDDGRRYKFTGAAWQPTRPLNNLTATAAPGANDDETDGYEPLSRWVDTSEGEFYVCLNATEGAAVWQLASLTIDDLGALALSDDAGDVPYSGSAPGSDVASALTGLQDQLGDQVVFQEGTVTIPSTSDSWYRSDFENLSFSTAFADGDYAVLFDYPSDAAAQSIGRLVAYDKAGNGCKVRATGSAGGTVRWVAVTLK